MSSHGHAHDDGKARLLDHDELESGELPVVKKGGSKVKLQLVWAAVFCVLFMIAEVVGGYLAGSLAIMTE
jgi:Co/Zn/Cd efflux system component